MSAFAQLISLVFYKANSSKSITIIKIPMKSSDIKRLYFIYISLLFLAIGCGAPTVDPEKIVYNFMKEGNVQGVFVAVVKGDSILYQKSFGVADKENGKAMTAETCMELGSISKAFTAEAIYDLHHQQLLNIDDPVTKYLTEAPANWSSVTIKHLLTHTSGIQNYLLDPRFKAAAYFGGTTDSTEENFINNVSTDSLLQMFYTLPFEFVPGASWSYSNTGYIILGKIAEKITGKNFFELVRERITSLLGMHYTTANEIALERGCLAKGYFIKDSSLHPSRVLKSNYAYSAGGWASTGNDMINYLRAIHKKTLPSDKAGYDWRNIQSNSELPFSYEGGRFFSTFHGLKIISHGGGTPGFTSTWLYVPDKNISIIVLTNRQDYAAIDETAWNILSSFEPALQYPEKKIEVEEEKRFSNKLVKVVKAIKTDSALPDGLSGPLSIFMKTENGKGFWKWYFERGYPETAYCVDKEIIDKYTAYRFRLPYSAAVEYRLTILVNEKNEIVQMRWW